MPTKNITPNEKIVPTPCRQCGEVFIARLADVKRGYGSFCTRACHVAHQRKVAVDQYAQRFWSKVDRSGGVDECWIWTAGRVAKGYGRFDRTYSHRIAWGLTNGAIPDGMVIMHKCDNPPCCNPAHLQTGTQLENVRDMLGKGRRPKQREATTSR